MSYAGAGLSSLGREPVAVPPSREKCAKTHTTMPGLEVGLISSTDGIHLDTRRSVGILPRTALLARQRRLMRKNDTMTDAAEFIDLALQRESSWLRAEEAEARLLPQMSGGGTGSDLKFYGASIGAVRGTVRDALRRHPDLTHDAVTALSSELWDEPVFERRLAAVVLLQSRAALLTNTDLTRIEGFLRTAGLRELADPLAVDVVGPLISRLDVVGRVRADSVLERWVRDPDPWLRRAALLSPLRALRAGAGDWSAFVRRARAVLADASQGQDDDGGIAAEAVAVVRADVAKHRPELEF